ncbi:pantoate--beta-alanine ligase [Bradyrhizobium sp. CCBAU 11361]|uniref:pantoate--beta-alanine ligase n=1 Tax=Bradyrhizobium sp. CCBAU 11361 TaxID=1630812 RepID=UPI0023039853|nr:pantoate--beta-alanine ligase [Bradyrhizobium sp. CCBAU 11361]
MCRSPEALALGAAVISCRRRYHCPAPGAFAFPFAPRSLGFHHFCERRLRCRENHSLREFVASPSLEVAVLILRARADHAPRRAEMALVEASRAQCDITVLSIFVNPAQFGPNEDLTTYPRDFARLPDVRLSGYRAAKARSFRAQARYGYVWVALDEPLSDIPAIPEDGMTGYRRINQFYDKWNTAALRLMENSFDNAHFAFVHKGTFGDINQPKPEKYEIVETEFGFDAETIITVRNPPGAYRITGTTEPTTRRHQRNKWFMPFCRRLDMEYPSGIRHIIFNCATPISDGQIQVVQLLFRNDTEAECSTRELIDWDAAIIADDRDMLESTDPDAIVDMGRKIEMHMPSDRPGMIMRKRLLDLLRQHGEEELPRSV